MANTFRIPLLNPSRWVNATANYSPKYKTKPFDDVVDRNGYMLPCEKIDTMKVQLYSDFPEMTGKIYKFSAYYDKVFYQNFDLIASPFAIVGVSFSVYEAAIDFAAFDEGIYYGEISYIDADLNVQTWRSCYWDVRANQPGTILTEYSNSVNDKDIIFDTGIVFELRLSATITNYEPGSDDEQYADEYYNILNENSIPFRTFIHAVYSKTKGVAPDWLIDKLNLIYSLNQVSHDGTYYNKFKGESFQLQRNAVGPNLDAMASIKIIPSDNLNLSKFTTTTPGTDNDIKVIVDDITYANKTESWILAGKFTSWFKLVEISFLNTGLDEFDIKFGTTAGGTEVGGTPYTVNGDLSQVIDIGHRFSETATLYVTVPLGVNLTNVVLVWYQYNAPNITPPDTSSPWQFGAEYEYIPRALDGFASAADMLTTHWNLATGFGNPDTAYEGCKIDDVLAGKVSVAWNRAAYLANPTNPLLQVGANVGNSGNTITLTVPQLPPHFHITDMHNNLAGFGHSIGGQGTAGDGSHTSSVGNGEPIDISNDGSLVIKFYRVT